MNDQLEAPLLSSRNSNETARYYTALSDTSIEEESESHTLERDSKSKAKEQTLSQDLAEGLGQSLPVQKKYFEGKASSQQQKSGIFTGDAQLDLYTLAPFLGVKERSVLARTSKDSLGFILRLEQQEKNKKKEEFKREMIKAPISPHYFRNKYRIKVGRFFEPFGERTGLIASAGDMNPELSNKHTFNCPILSPDGDRFLNLRGMMGNYPQQDLIFCMIKSYLCCCSSPLLILECCGIGAGDCYGRYLDYQSYEKLKNLLPPTPKAFPGAMNSPSPSLAKQTAVQWADDCNPCGSQSIHPSDCSIIAPPAPAKSDFGLILISDTGKCQLPQVQQSESEWHWSDFNNCGKFLIVACCPYITCIYLTAITLISPCLISSCVGYCCGYVRGSIKEGQQPQASLLPQPPTQRMV